MISSNNQQNVKTHHSLLFRFSISIGVCLCVCTCTHLHACTKHVCGGQKTVCGSQFSSSTVWASGLELGLSGLIAGAPRCCDILLLHTAVPMRSGEKELSVWLPSVLLLSQHRNSGNHLLIHRYVM